MRKSGVGVRLVVDVHQLANGGVRVFLRGRERLVPEKFLNGAKISAVSKQMRRERVTQRMWMQVPIDIGDAHVCFHYAPDGTLRKAPAQIVEKDSFRVRSLLAVSPTRLPQELFAHRPVFFQGLLGLGSVRNDTFFVAFAADPEDAFFLLHVGKIEPGELTDAQA